MASSETSLDDMSQLFTYETLQRQHSIRILWLYPGHVDDLIGCDLSILGLDGIESSQAHEAISYAWGNITKGETIICSGKFFSITRALFEAFQVFRRPDGDGKRALWADNICINQDDTGERSHQLQPMRWVYTAASKVLIWLVHGVPEKIEASLNLACQVSKRALSQEFKSSEGMARSLEDTIKPQYARREHISSRSIIKSSKQFTLISQRVRALCSLFDCRCFNRLWVTQELALSRAAEVF